MSLRLSITVSLALLLGLGPASLAHSGPADDVPARSPLVQVRLLEEVAPRTVEVAGHEGALLIYAAADDEAPLLEVDAGEPLTLTLAHGEVRLSGGALAVRMRAVEVVAEREMAVSVTEGAQTIAGRTYPGSLRITPDPDQPSALLLVNEVALETYVAHVVAREYSFDDLEGAKAMAVLARTYALRAMASAAPGAAYHLDDHIGSQAYDGTSRQTDAALEATRQTTAEVLAYRQELAEAVYFASSGGHTADNEDVWDGTPRPYLRGIEDPYDARTSPYASWTSRLSRPTLLRALSDAYGFDVEGFVIDERSADGRVQTVKLLRDRGADRTISGNDFRLLVNRTFGKTELRSTLFTAKRSGSTYVLEGRGSGHGVGLSQYGALAQSREGRSYRDILAYYFQGTSVVAAAHIDEAAEVPPMVALDTPETLDTATTPAVDAGLSTASDSTATSATQGSPTAQADAAKATPGKKKRTTRRIGW